MGTIEQYSYTTKDIRYLAKGEARRDEALVGKWSVPDNLSALLGWFVSQAFDLMEAPELLIVLLAWS
jgi:hypothetical protein